MDDYVLQFEDIDETRIASVGGKAAHLAELSRIDDLRVPAGFCVTTDAFQRIITEIPSLEDALGRLARLEPNDRESIGAVSAQIRRSIEKITVPDDVAAAIRRSVARIGEHAAFAVRSSATAEDLPTASFAGQLESYLNVVGAASILEHVSRCWASLFTDRAVTYRLRNGFDHRTVQMAVVVQRMIFPHAAGTLFTADPVTGNRKVASVEASFGLGDALVSGLVNPDVYKVHEGQIIARTIGLKRLAVQPSQSGGTQQHEIGPEHQQQPALTDAQIVRLAALGRRIEAHFRKPQDIEWCLADGHFHIVQSRPITTLFPVPESGDQEKHVYISVGHQQMMTDAMKPLGLSVWQMTTPRPMAEAGGRLFVDVTQILASPASRAGLLAMAGRSDPLIGDALQTLLDRGDDVPSAAEENPTWTPPGGGHAIEADPAIVEALIVRAEASLAALKRTIRTKSGTALLDFIVADVQEMKRIQFDPQNLQAVMAGIEATWQLNERLEAWLGEKNAADTLAQSAPRNVTSEMGLALLDVADVIRPHPDVVAFLRRVQDEQQVDDQRFLDALLEIDGGRDARDAIAAWLEKYGMRCVGEIDITRPRWAERPAALVPVILGHIRTFEPGAGKRRFDDGRRQALQKEQELLARLRTLPDGASKAEDGRRLIERLRTFMGYREYPKYAIVSRYFVYKQALLEEAERLVRAQVLREKEDIFFLRFEELQDVVRTNRVDPQLIRQRKEAFRSYQALTPPRVLTSEGEALTGSYRRDVPAGALVGLPVSAGIVEGRARVVLDIADASLEPGDILVTAYTDPSWTPLFVAIEGLVTEVGGLMTHGSVIAREYGVPAVVGVEHATRKIQDGQRIRVHGTEGYVEVLPAPDRAT